MVKCGKKKKCRLRLCGVLTPEDGASGQQLRRSSFILWAAGMVASLGSHVDQDTLATGWRIGGRGVRLRPTMRWKQ